VWNSSSRRLLKDEGGRQKDEWKDEGGRMKRRIKPEGKKLHPSSFIFHPCIYA